MLKLFKILFFIGLLISVRLFEKELFYDPFLAFFKGNTTTENLPKYDDLKLILNLIFRMGLNFILSLFLFHSLFGNKKRTQQLAIILGVIQIAALMFYIYIIKTQFEIGFLFGFYVRRIVIQPLLILVLIPLFYYQKNQN